MALDGQDEIVKELVNSQIPRVDAVDGPAHGAGFLVVKSQASVAAEPIDLDEVNKAAGTSEDPDDSATVTGEADTAASQDADEEAAAGGATGTAPGAVDGAPSMKGVQGSSSSGSPTNAQVAKDEEGTVAGFQTVAEAIFGLRKTLEESGASAAVLGAVDNVGLTLDGVVKANTGMEAGLDADGDGDGDTNTDADALTEENNTQIKKSQDVVPAGYEILTPEALSKSLEPVFKSIVEGALREGLAPLEKRLETVENQPQSGGPLLNGAGGPPRSDFYVVEKSSERAQTDAGDGTVEALEKALAYVQDPYERERIQQLIARSVHPMHGANG